VLVINLDKRQFTNLARQLPARHQSAMRTALRAEARRLYLKEREFGRQWGAGEWEPAHPLTKAIRKQRRQGLGKWWARFARYHVDTKRLEALAGILSSDQVSRREARFEPISRGFASAAYRHARGYRFKVTRETQRQIAKILNKRFKTKRYHKLIPRIGWHTVEPRPVAEVVYRREAERSIRNIRQLYKIKMEGGRYSRSWISEWGNA